MGSEFIGTRAYLILRIAGNWSCCVLFGTPRPVILLLFAKSEMVCDPVQVVIGMSFRKPGTMVAITTTL